MKRSPLKLIYKTLENEYDMVLSKNVLVIKTLGISLQVSNNILGIYAPTKTITTIPNFYKTPKKLICFLDLNTLSIFPKTLNKKNEDFLILAYIIKEILK